MFSSFVAFDWVVLGIVIISAMVGAFRGFIRESLSLLAWVVAIWLAFHYSGSFSDYLSSYINNGTVRILVVASVMILGVMLLSNLLKSLILWVLNKTGLIAFDRVLGLVFGTVRGLLICMLMVQLLSLTGLADQSWWQYSRLVDPMKNAASKMSDILPKPIDHLWDHYVMGKGLVDVKKHKADDPEYTPKQTEEVGSDQNSENLLKTDVDDFVEFDG